MNVSMWLYFYTFHLHPPKLFIRLDYKQHSYKRWVYIILHSSLEKDLFCFFDLNVFNFLSI